MPNVPDSKTREIRVTNVPATTKQALINISKNTGIGMTSLIKPKLTELVNSYPPHMREYKGGD